MQDVLAFACCLQEIAGDKIAEVQIKRQMTIDSIPDLEPELRTNSPMRHPDTVAKHTHQGLDAKLTERSQGCVRTPARVDAACYYGYVCNNRNNGIT